MARREPPRPPPRPPLTLLASISQQGSISLSAPNSALLPGDDSPVHVNAGHQRSSSQRLTPNPNDHLDHSSNAPPSPLSPGGIPSQSYAARDSLDESPPRPHDSEQRMSISLSSNSTISAVLLEGSSATDAHDGSMIMHPNPLNAPHSPGSEQAVAMPSTPSPTPSITSQTMKVTRSAQQKSQAAHNKHHLYLDEERGIGDRSDDSGSAAASPRHKSNNSISLSDISIDSAIKEFRIDVSNPVKLQSIMHLQQSRIENRFANDFVPSLPAEMSHELLVSTAMDQFSAPLKQIIKEDIAYKQEKPKKVRLLDYEIDEPVKAVARYELHKAKNKPPTLTEMFVQPGSSPSSTVSDKSQASPKPVENTSPLDSSCVFETNGSLGKYQDLGTPEDLVDATMFHVQLDHATAVIREEQKNSTREGFFWRASPLYNFDPNITAETLVVKRTTSPFWTQMAPQVAQLLVSVQSLKLAGPSIEPLYCSLSIIDLKHEERCSEDFHFDLNDVPLLTGHLQVEATLADPLTLCKHALFGLHERNRHEHTVFVIKIERILAGDQSTDLDYYLKAKPRTTPELAVIGKKIRANLLSLSEYRQPFAWGMAPIFDGNGDLRFRSGSTVRIDKLFFQPESQKDDQFIAQAKEAAADGSKKHRQFVSSHFDFRVDELDVTNLPPNRVDPCCIPLKDSSNIHPLPMVSELNTIADFVAGSVSPSQSHNSASKAPQRSVSICKEILDFSTASSAVPFTSFVNLLYVYPEFIKFDKYRNIACRVQIRANDAVVDTVGTGSSGVNPEVPRLIMGKSSTSSFCASAMTQVNYHKRSVNPQDEVKLMLPMNLTSTHHLFFTFYKVSCKNKPGSRELIGYSVLPVYQRHRLISNDVYHLPIASKLPKGYMAPFIEGVSNSDIQFLHGGAKSVSVRIRGISSVFNSDEQVSNFLQTFPNVKEVAAIGAERARDLCTKAVECLPRCNELLTVQFLPSILDLMFDLLVTRSTSPNSQLYAFHALTHIVQRVSDFHNEPHRCTLLAAYVQHRLDHRHPEHPPVYVAVSRTWLAALQQREASLQPSSSTSPLRLPSPSASQASLDRSFVMYSWFFFETLTKSLSLSRCANPTRTLDSAHEKEFLSNMALLVPVFVRLAQSHRSVGLTMVKSLVNNLAAFFLDCFYVLRKEQVIEWISVFCRGLHNVARDPVLVEMKFSFHSIILDHPAYPDLTELREMNCEPFEARVKAVGGTRSTEKESQTEMQDDAPHPSHTSQQTPVRREKEEADPSEPDSRSRIIRDFFESIRSAFPLAHLMLDDYITHIGDKEAVIKEQVIDTLRNFLTKIDYDRRWRSAKPLIATMLFPLIPALLEQFDLISRIESKVRRQVLAPVLFILHQVPERVLNLWWSCEAVDDQANFLDLLRFVIVDFHYVGVKAREDDPDANCILAPESIDAMNVSQGSMARASSIGDYKTDIESYMASIHKVRTQAGSRAKMQAITSAHHNHAHAAGTITQMPSLDRASTHLPSISHTLHANTMSSAQFAAALNTSLQASSSTSNLTSGTATTAVAGPVTSLRQLRAGLSSRSLSGNTLRGTKTSNNTISGSNLEFALTTARLEGALTRQVARVVVLTLARFFHAYTINEIADSDVTFLAYSTLLSQIVSSNQANSFLIAFFPLVLLFVEQLGFAAHRTSERTASIGQLANAVFRAASFTSRAVRRHAVTIIYALLQNEYKIERDLTGMQIQLTIALSKLTDTLTAVNEKCLQQTFAALVKMGETIPIEQPTNHSPSKNPVDSADFTLKLNTLLSRLSTILGDSMEISRQTALGSDADSATSENLLCQVADAFSHLPDIRIEWLLRLAKHHKKRAANAEAAQCYLLVASLASRLPLNPASTSVKHDRTVMEYLEVACDQLDRGELYEQCNDVYHVLLPYYHRTHDYVRLSKAHMHIHSIFDRLIAANKAQTRMLGTYYRIGFYGRKFGPRLNGTELVYKTPKITRLSEISSSMRALYAKQLGCAVRVLPDSGPVDRSKLDPEECVLQVTFVTPYFGADCPDIERLPASQIAASHSSPTSGFSNHKNAIVLPAIETLRPSSGLLHYEEPRPRDTFIERHSFIQHFHFSTPFSATGKSHASIAEQQKRNTILTVKHPFPSILTAQLVIAKSERVLTPIESATDDVQHRTAKLAEIIDSPTPNVKAITNILQGSVAAQVNGGAREICHSFLQPLGDDEELDESIDREKLRAALRDFLTVCVRGLELNNQLSSSDAEKDFQRNLENSYEEMLTSMRKCLYREAKRKGSTLQQLPNVSFAN